MLQKQNIPKEKNHQYLFWMFNLKMIDCFSSQKKRRVIRKCMLWIYLSSLHWLWICHRFKKHTRIKKLCSRYIVLNYIFFSFPLSCSLAFEITCQTYQCPMGNVSFKVSDHKKFSLTLFSQMFPQWTLIPIPATNTNCETTSDALCGRSSFHQSMTWWVGFSSCESKSFDRKRGVTAATRWLVSNIEDFVGFVGKVLINPTSPLGCFTTANHLPSSNPLILWFLFPHTN